MTVHVEEVQTRVVPAPASGEDPRSGSTPPRPGAAEESWAAAYRLVQRDGRRTAARDFDD